MFERVLILHNIRSALNVGAIFRTAESIGMTRLCLTGYTPLPVDRFGFPDKQIAKTALGSELRVPWVHEQDISLLIARLRSEGCAIIGLEIDPRAIDYKEYIPKGNVAILLGSEVEGVAPELRNEVDVLVSIPMRGEKESLNVSVATGILLYRLFDH